jgi:hypothetical protein
MDVFLVLQILFDAVLLFGVLFLFHFSVNQQQRRKEELDIVNNIQVQETKENLEKLLTTMKQLGKDVSDEIEKKIAESEEKAEVFNRSIQKLETELKATMELAGEITAERNRLEGKVKVIRSMPDKREKLPSDEKISSRTSSKSEKRKKIPEVKSNPYSVGFSSGVVRQVYKMADAEAELAEIARVTKLSKAEVSLILNLRENRFTAPN